MWPHLLPSFSCTSSVSATLAFLLLLPRARRDLTFVLWCPLFPRSRRFPSQILGGFHSLALPGFLLRWHLLRGPSPTTATQTISPQAFYPVLASTTKYICLFPHLLVTPTLDFVKAGTGSLWFPISPQHLDGVQLGAQSLLLGIQKMLNKWKVQWMYQSE